MKTFKLLPFILFVISCHTVFSQNRNNYESRWKLVDSMMQIKKLPKTALTEVKKIYALASKEHQEDQKIKALMYMVTLQNENREENLTQSIKEIEQEITLASEPSKSILENLNAQLYWYYMQSNMYKLYSRTNTEKIIKDDISTWTLNDFHKKITREFLTSLSNKSLLEKTDLKRFDAIIMKGNVRYLRPTLYDLLAHQALDYFKNDEITGIKPQNAFELNDPEAFASADVFIHHNFNTVDSLSTTYHALLIFKQLIGFHLNDTKTDALTDVDIERLSYVYNKSVNENKEALYERALKNITLDHKSDHSYSAAWYLLAKLYTDHANEYNPLGDTTYRWERSKARNILMQVVSDSSVKNQGWINSYNLLQQIQKKSFSYKLEEVNIPGKPFRALVSYKNISSLQFRIIRVDQNIKDLYKKDQTNFWKTIYKWPFIREWAQGFPINTDYQQHSAEIKIDALTPGQYMLIGTPGKGFNSTGEIVGMMMFQVSTISFIKNDNQFFVLDRETGEPVKNAVITISQEKYDPKSSRYILSINEKAHTDANGYARMKKINSEIYNAANVTIQYLKDSLTDNIPYYYADNSTEEPEDYSAVFFTDRSIYRPGQVVYFKGILMKNSENNHVILPDYKTRIFLYNANDEIIDSLDQTSNDFGSINGKFKLPATSLNGDFYISDNKNNSVHFSVEEYKRPKYYIHFDIDSTPYKVGDTISVTGETIAYAGNMINEAHISYRIIRQPVFQYKYEWHHRGETNEIAHGEILSDKNGKFIITFVASPDKKINKESDPIFNFEISIDATDITGETRSSNTLVKAAYSSLFLKAEVPSKSSVDSFNNISVHSENINGVYVPSVLHISIRKLLPENRLIKSRYWDAPDQYVMTKKEFTNYFPNDEYYNETDIKTWAEGETVFERTDSSNEDGQFNISKTGFKTGDYKIIIETKDREGRLISTVQYISLYDLHLKKPDHPEYLWTVAPDISIEPGQKETIMIGSSANIHLIKEVLKQFDTVPSYSFYKLSNEVTSEEYIGKEEDRGGYRVNYVFVKDNRFYQASEIIKIPWSNKELNIEYNTFRDKILPGSNEKWQIRINGIKKEKIAAEVLASMYDASLDQYRINDWLVPYIWQPFDRFDNWDANDNFSQMESNQNDVPVPYLISNKKYDVLYSLNIHNQKFRGAEISIDKDVSQVVVTGYGLTKKTASKNAQNEDSASVSTGYYNPTTKRPGNTIEVRKNLNETAFFYPELHTDSSGNIDLSFTIPEALTTWKLQTLAHTKDLAFGLSKKEIITQKPFMVQSSMPRFLRAGDHIDLTAKLVNLSDKEITGQVQLELIDARTNQSVDGWFMNTFPNQYFTIGAKQNELVKFPVQVPFQFTNTLLWRITARTFDSSRQQQNELSDGEQDLIPVLTNKVLVTETLPLFLNGNGSKNYSFTNLLKASNSESLLHQSLTVEYTSNPSWYAIQALPYLMEFPYECAEQTWNRYYANTIASKIINSSPRIRNIFSQWQTSDSSVFLSALEKNQELKSAFLEETPWVLAARSEDEQKKNLAALFDMVRMSNELTANLNKLKNMQMENGAFPWFQGGPDDRYITQYILTGIGHLKKLNAFTAEVKEEINTVVEQALSYLDEKMAEDYKTQLKKKAVFVPHEDIQYLYMRSFFNDHPIPIQFQPAYKFYLNWSQKNWMNQNNYMEGMIALVLMRNGKRQVAADIIHSLKERSIKNEETGMYWNEYNSQYGLYWYQAPIETQALLIEAFNESGNEPESVNEMKTWLIRKKQTNNWPTTTSTAEACYAFLMQGADWLISEPSVQIKIGAQDVSNGLQKTEAGTGYFKKIFQGTDVKPEMGNISIVVQDTMKKENLSHMPSWGAVYWQYFEDVDKIKVAGTGLQVTKKLFIEKNTDEGPKLYPIEENSSLHIGDKVIVRIIIKSDRDLEYVHMKDMRASSLEPVQVISEYKWQGGLGYYETTKDASTDFFFNYIPKGNYVFEYSLFVSQTGKFDNGITSLQCMYAPEFSAHSDGVKINVE